MRDAAHARNHGQLGTRWNDLHAKAEQIARLAAISTPSDAVSPQDFEALFAQATDWQQGIVARGIEDIEAMIGPGLSALATLVERGCPTEPPALALWREFHHASEAVLSALAPHRQAA